MLPLSNNLQIIFLINTHVCAVFVDSTSRGAINCNGYNYEKLIVPDEKQNCRTVRYNESVHSRGGEGRSGKWDHRRGRKRSVGRLICTT